jgi:hypothetical protein
MAISALTGTPSPLLETDVPERKNQNTYLVKYLFHSACGRQGDSEIGWRIFG